MNLYWFWPYLRQEELVIAEGAVQPGDHLVVHTTNRVDEPVVAQVPGCVVEPTLIGVAPREEGSLRWAVSRATTYVQRARARSRAVREGGFDVAHMMYLNPFVDAVDLSRLGRRIPLVSTVHDVVPHQSRVPAAVEHRMLARQYRYGGTLIVSHGVMRRRLVEEFDVDPARIVVMSQDIPVMPPRPTPPPDRPPTVLFFGTFRPNKGIDVLLDAIAQLDDEARFLFAGRGAEEIERAVVEAARRDPRIELELGYANAARKNELHASADLIVLPYTSFASQSGVLYDAYSHGVPLVVTDVGVLGVTVREESTGWVVLPRDASALAAAISTALHDPKARAAASEAQRAIAATRTPTLTGARIREVYEQTIAAWR
ncbi:MAG: glycosyltransferase family 4 protein [Acidimicrobiia bacterium]